MASFAALSPQDRWNIVNYVYTLRGKKMALPAAPDVTAAPGSAAAQAVMALLDSALEFAKPGTVRSGRSRVRCVHRIRAARDSGAREAAGTVASMERHFADFKGSGAEKI